MRLVVTSLMHNYSLGLLVLGLALLVGCSDSPAPADGGSILSDWGVPDFGPLPRDLGPPRDAAGLIGDPCAASDECRYGDCASYTLDSPSYCWGLLGCDLGRNLGCPAEAICVPGCDSCPFSPEYPGFCLRACDADGGCPTAFVCKVDSRGVYPTRHYCYLPPVSM